MKTIDDLKAKLAEIKDAEKAVDDAEEHLEEVSKDFYYDVCRIVNIAIERAFCESIYHVHLDGDTLHVSYEYYCHGDSGNDRCNIPVKYLFMNDDEIKKDAEDRRQKAKAEEEAKDKEAKDKAEFEMYLKLKEKYEDKT